MSLREMATRCGHCSLVPGSVSPSYISRLERGTDTLISPEILVMFKDVLVVSYNELLEHLTERNYVRFSHYLKHKQKVRISEFGDSDKDDEWYAFLQRVHGVSRKVIEPLLWDMVSRHVIGCELIPYTWPEDFWAGMATIEDLGDCMANLADIADGLSDSNDRVALAAAAAIEAALGSEYIAERRWKRIRFERLLKTRLKKKTASENNQ